MPSVGSRGPTARTSIVANCVRPRRRVCAPPPAGDRSGDPIARGRRRGRQRQKDRMTRWTQLFEDPDAGTSRSVCPVEAAGASSVPPARVMS